MHGSSRNALVCARVRLVDAPRIYISEPNWTWDTRIPNYYNLWIALRGTGAMRVEHHVHAIQPGVAFLLAPGTRVQATHDRRDPVHNFAMHFLPFDARGRLISRARFPPGAIRLRHVALADLAAQRLARLRHTGDIAADNAAAAWAYALLMQILADAQEPPPDLTDERILRLAERIAANPAGAWRVARLAQDAGLSRARFAGRFKRLLGETPIQFIMRRRIERASVLIEQSAMKLADIAESLGYADVYFFSRQFKRVKGFPPSRLRAAGTERHQPLAPMRRNR